MQKRSVKLIFLVFFCSLLGQQAFALDFAESSYNFWRKKCPKPVTEITPSPMCFAKTEGMRVDIIRKNMGEASEKALLASLALEKSQVFDCSRNQLSALQQNPDHAKAFVKDYVDKLTLLGHEKRRISELRAKINKSKEELDEYDMALLRAEMILASMPYAHLKPFQKAIKYAAQQYDISTPEKLENWLPQQMEKMLMKAIPETIKEVEKNKAILDEGVVTFSDSLSLAEKESLAGDADLIETFRKKHINKEKEIMPALCQLDAKYGAGAEYRDRSLLGVSLLGLPATGLWRVGALGVGSSVARIATLGQVSFRTGAVMRLVAATGGAAVGITQIQKACFQNYTELAAEKSEDQGPQVCEENILKSQSRENCILVSALQAVGLPMNVKGVYDTVKSLKLGYYLKYTAEQKAAIQRAHQVGFGEMGADKTSPAKVGNYTFSQKKEKAKILKDAGIAASDRRRLFEDGIVGHGEYIDDLIGVESQILKLEGEAWRLSANQKNTSQELAVIRKELDEALDADPSEMVDRIAKLRERIAKFGMAKPQEVVKAKVSDILENPQLLRQGKIIALSPEGKNNFGMKFEPEALDGLLSAEKPIIQKFMTAIRVGGQGESVDPTKIKHMVGWSVGAKGKPFEVRIINSGHQRLYGCLKDGIFTVYKYDPSSPQRGQEMKRIYNDICL